MSSTLVITGGDENCKRVLELTNRSKARWCNKNNYDYLVVRQWLARPKLGFEGNLNHLGFLRAVVCFEQLRYYDNVMWIDGDSIITNDKYKIEDFVEDNEACFFASYNWMYNERCPGGFTTGNFIIKRNNKVEDLFNAFIAHSKIYLNHICQELVTFNDLHKSDEFRSQIKVLPHKFLNSCPVHLYETPTWRADNQRRLAPECVWNEESFLAHLTGCTFEEREDLLLRYFSQYI